MLPMGQCLTRGSGADALIVKPLDHLGIPTRSAECRSDGEQRRMNGTPGWGVGKCRVPLDATALASTRCGRSALIPIRARGRTRDRRRRRRHIGRRREGLIGSPPRAVEIEQVAVVGVTRNHSMRCTMLPPEGSSPEGSTNAKGLFADIAVQVPALRIQRVCHGIPRRIGRREPPLSSAHITRLKKVQSRICIAVLAGKLRSQAVAHSPRGGASRIARRNLHAERHIIVPQRVLPRHRDYASRPSPFAYSRDDPTKDSTSYRGTSPEKDCTPRPRFPERGSCT